MIRFSHWLESVRTLVSFRSPHAGPRARGPVQMVSDGSPRAALPARSARLGIVAVLIAGCLTLGGTAALAEDAMAAAPLDINTASAEMLAEQLERIGKVRAEAIIAWREENGRFSSVDQLILVPGISQSVVDLNRDRVIVK